MRKWNSEGIHEVNNIRVLMFSKKNNIFCNYAESILKSYFSEDEFLSVRGHSGDHFDDTLYSCRPEYIISFVSPWIVPKRLLDVTQKAAINFHPGSPDYPGTGCYNFALYDETNRYGVTVHYMEEKVDSGQIIMTSYFDIAPYESVETLKLKSMNHLLYCFENIMRCISKNEPLPKSDEKWRHKPFTRKEMLELFRIDVSTHNEDEVRKRIRAANYPGLSGAFVEIANHKFYFPYESRKPIVD